MRRILSLLVTLASGVVIGAAAAPMTVADPGVKLTYRVTLQDPGTNRQVTISYRTGKGEKAVKQTWLDPFVPWEHDVTMTTREAVVSLFSDPGVTISVRSCGTATSSRPTACIWSPAGWRSRALPMGRRHCWHAPTCPDLTSKRRPVAPGHRHGLRCLPGTATALAAGRLRWGHESSRCPAGSVLPGAHSRES